MKRLAISVRGTVQGVGFRPFIYNLALGLGITGWVTNTSSGVSIEAEGERLDEFIRDIRDKCPPIAGIDAIDLEELPVRGDGSFAIIDSADAGSFTLVPPDISICEDCAKEMLNPTDRRYLYPFINCTNCGPRYSITKGVPYDRQNTTMAAFEMCSGCLSEYNDPSDRRFHAQPNACPKCGPSLELRIRNYESGIKGKQLRIRNYELGIKGEDPIKGTIELLRQGAIVAIKGLGGFHLCCDASNEEAVRRLREKKRKSNKPFALMSPDVETIRNYCEVSEEERALLEDMRRPVVLLRKKESCRLSTVGNQIQDAVSPNNKYIGFMLPYTPLHYLLFSYPSFHTARNSFKALVMTSGNLSEEPIVTSNEEALARLSGIADAFLLHDRDIFMRVDDSVVKAVGTESPCRMSFIRRARGYVPGPVRLDEDGPDVLGCGADLKNTFTITKGKYAIPSQHIGDMENLETLRFFEETLANLKQVYRSTPVAIGHDLHPGYLSTRWALEQQSAGGNTIKTYGIQHHWAHVASVMAEHGLKEKIIGVAFDGTGYGTDGNIWGSEVLVCDTGGFTRAAHFRYMPLPGSEMAVKECWRTAISCVASCHGPIETGRDLIMDSLGAVGFFKKYGWAGTDNVLGLIGKRQFSPLSSGAGRLFDAVSALAGICDVNSYEGEAAIALENAMQGAELSGAYQYEISGPLSDAPIIIDFSKMILDIIGDVKQGTAKGRISAKFHNTLVNVTARVVGLVGSRSGLRKVALSGGVFQNEYLLRGVFEKLTTDGFEVYTNGKVPCNDAGISLGQAYIVREKTG